VILSFAKVHNVVHQLRQSQAGDLFLGVYEKSKSGSRTLIGFVCSTLSPAESLTHESMSTHVPDSSAVCIHSVCVAKSHQRNGIGLALLKEYIHRLESRNVNGVKYHRVLLITHEELRPFYELAGFEWRGPSSVVHGSRAWFEMRRDLKLPSRSNSSKETPERMIQGHASIPSNILDALGRPKDKILAGKLISDFHHGLSDLLELDDASPGISVNKYNLVCSRAECGSLVLKKGAAKWVERASVQASQCYNYCCSVVLMLYH
jgi:GNAT superfamily N-acetyltransferase